jgi:hypothetical protein
MRDAVAIFKHIELLQNLRLKCERRHHIPEYDIEEIFSHAESLMRLSRKETMKDERES